MTSQQPDLASTSRFFDDHQRATIEAAMARIIPTDDTPGAVEAGTIDFLDRYLSGIDYIYAKPDGSGFEELSGKRADAWQQRVEIVRERYVSGVRDLDERARAAHHADFVDLTAEQQDGVLRDLERPDQQEETELAKAEATLYGAPVEPALQQTSTEVDLGFVPLLALHTRQGFYADPIYGGNRNKAGWRLIGFPGAIAVHRENVEKYRDKKFPADPISISDMS